MFGSRIEISLFCFFGWNLEVEDVNELVPRHVAFTSKVCLPRVCRFIETR